PVVTHLTNPRLWSTTAMESTAATQERRNIQFIRLRMLRLRAVRSGKRAHIGVALLNRRRRTRGLNGNRRPEELALTRSPIPSMGAVEEIVVEGRRRHRNQLRVGVALRVFRPRHVLAVVSGSRLSVELGFGAGLHLS